MKIFLIFWSLMVLGKVSAVAQQLKIYSFEEAEMLQLKEKRNLVVLVGTDWCKYCQMMKQVSLKNKAVVDLLNTKFYFVYLNAEDKMPIKFNGQLFKFKPTGLNTGLNELAIALTTDDGSTTFPTICVLNSLNEIVFQYQHYINKKDMVKVLTELLNKSRSQE